MEKFLGSTKNNLIRNRRGQFAIEAVLLLTLLVGISLSIFNFVKGPPSLLQKLVTTKVIARFSTITSFGTWNSDGCTAPGKAKQTLGKCHPNSIHRSLSSDPGP